MAEDEAVTFEVVDPASPEAVAAVMAYVEELDEQFPGGFEPGDTVTADAEAYREPQGRFVLARTDGSVVGCGAVTTLERGLGEIKRMWVAPSARGAGVGRRLLAALEHHARDLGHDRVRLDTNGVLTPAIAMYRGAGYVEIESYNDNPYAEHWFEKALS